MHEKTECRYSYEPIKKGRSVVAVRFEVETLPKVIHEEDENQITIEQWQAETEAKKQELWQEPLVEFGFSQEQLAELDSILVTIPEAKLPESSACYGSIELMRYHYIQQKAAEITRRDKEKPIRSKYSYLLKLMKQDAAERR